MMHHHTWHTGSYTSIFNEFFRELKSHPIVHPILPFALLKNQPFGETSKLYKIIIKNIKIPINMTISYATLQSHCFKQNCWYI